MYWVADARQGGKIYLQSLIFLIYELGGIALPLRFDSQRTLIPTFIIFVTFLGELCVKLTRILGQTLV